MFDTAIEFQENSAVVCKGVSGSEPFALGHYPRDPIFPGVLALDLMLELGEALASREIKCPLKRVHIVRAQYLGTIIPGDTIRVNAEIKKRMSKKVKISAYVMVENVPKIRAALEFQFS